MKPTTFVALGLIAALLLVAVPAFAAPPRPSPSATVTQTIGLSEVTVTYCRPGVKGRTVFGDLEPWGSVWRTGANEATTITFSHPAKVGGKDVTAGTYALFTIPQEKGKWTVILNKEHEQWGAFQYKEGEDAVRVEVEPQKASHQENFEISFQDLTDNSGHVSLHWQETRYGFDIEFDTAGLAVEVAEQEAGEPRAAYGWAQFFYNQNANLENALTYATKATEAQERYWPYALKARITQALGKTDDAKKLAMKAIELAPKDQFAEQAEAAAKDLGEEMKKW